jgi:YgiT-type zinc finger domain-containing protein
LDTVSKGDDAMKCQTPGCSGEREARAISHAVIYQERTLVIHDVPADVCPECGEAALSEETTMHLELLLRRKARSKGTAFRFAI